jgi:hypothetical protein
MDVYDQGSFNLDELKSQMKQASIIIECLSDSGFRNSIFYHMQRKYALINKQIVITILMNKNLTVKELDEYQACVILDLNSYDINDLASFYQDIVDNINICKSNFNGNLNEDVIKSDEKYLKKLSILGNKTESETSDDEKSENECGELNVSISVSGESKINDDIEIEEQISEVKVEEQDPSDYSIVKSLEMPNSELTSKWDQSQVKLWFELNSINLAIYRSLGRCDGELLFTYSQILSIQPKFFI